MTSKEAKDILLLYRPDTADAEDPEIVAAMDVARREPELARWFEQHCAFQSAMRAKFREVEAPLHLKAALIAQQDVIRPPIWRRRPVWLAAAAAIALLLALAAFWLRPTKPDQFANFQSRMVSTALREYRMDVVTNDMRQLRKFLASRGAPAAYHVPKRLEKLELTGGGCLQWRSNPVAMVCFDRGDNQMLFLFVMKRSALSHPPPETPQTSNVAALQTASWSHGEYTYLLAGPADPEFLRKYL